MLTPFPYRARARSGDAVVGDTTDALRVDHDGAAEPPELWFPSGDVRIDIAGRLDDSAVRRGAGPLEGYVAFDPGRVEVEVIDGRAGDDERDVTVKRFPTWGDAADLVALLDVQPQTDGVWLGAARSDVLRPVVEGSQLLGQAVVAASRHTGNRRAVFASMVFARAADARFPVPIELDEVQAGRTFSTFTARAVQRGRVCGAGTLLLDATADDVVRHAAPAPDTAGPYDAVPYDMGVTGRDLRIVDGAYTGDPGAPVGPPVLDAWVRFRDLPADPAIHAGIAVQFMGHMPIAAALRPHAGVGQDQAHRTLSTAINAINVSLHAEVRADRWLLYRHLSTFAGDGMTHAECRTYTEDGTLVASFTVDAMVRPFADPTAPVDERRTM